MADLGNNAITSLIFNTKYEYYVLPAGSNSIIFNTKYEYYVLPAGSNSIIEPTYYIAEYPTSSITNNIKHSMPDITKSLFMPKTLHKLVCYTTPYTIGTTSGIEGTLEPPSINIPVNGMFRFRWAFGSGTRTISVSAKQPKNGTPRPTVVIKSNSSVGIPIDVSESAIPDNGWVTIGPITINPTTSGATWVELHNNYEGINEPCYFDNIITT